MKQRKLNILIRTAGGTNTNQELGFGHVYRCVNLASFLSGHNITFLLEDYGGAKKILREKGYSRVSLLRRNINVASDLRSTISAIKKGKIDVLIIDRYRVKKKYVSQIRRYVKTVLISDLFNTKYDVDLLVNGFVGLKNQVKKNRNTKCLFGPRYQILSKEFAEPPAKPGKKFELLVTLGGFDKKNVVKMVLRSLAKNEIKTKIILGPGTAFTDDIKTLAKRCRSVQIQQKTNNMKKEILGSAFGICSGGITSYEFAALGVPFAIVCQARHQLVTAKYWQRNGIALNLGLATKKVEGRIDNLLKEIAENKIAMKGRKIIDGFGSKLVSDEIIKMVA